MHDAVTAERLGTAAVGIMTSAFVDGAALMASALGAAGYRFVVIEHPIASANDAELEAKAVATIEQAVRLVQAAL